MLCDQARDLLARLDLQQGAVAEKVLMRRAGVLNALGRPAEALTDIDLAPAMWHRLAPAGDLHRTELLDVRASIQARPGVVRSARDTARQAVALVKHRNWIEPALWKRIEALAGSEN